MDHLPLLIVCKCKFSYTGMKISKNNGTQNIKNCFIIIRLPVTYYYQHYSVTKALSSLIFGLTTVTQGWKLGILDVNLSVCLSVCHQGSHYETQKQMKNRILCLTNSVCPLYINWKGLVSCTSMTYTRETRKSLVIYKWGWWAF